MSGHFTINCFGLCVRWIENREKTSLILDTLQWQIHKKVESNKRNKFGENEGKLRDKVKEKLGRSELKMRRNGTSRQNRKKLKKFYIFKMWDFLLVKTPLWSTICWHLFLFGCLQSHCLIFHGNCIEFNCYKKLTVERVSQSNFFKYLRKIQFNFYFPHVWECVDEALFFMAWLITCSGRKSYLFPIWTHIVPMKWIELFTRSTYDTHKHTWNEHQTKNPPPSLPIFPS